MATRTTRTARAETRWDHCSAIHWLLLLPFALYPWGVSAVGMRRVEDSAKVIHRRSLLRAGSRHSVGGRPTRLGENNTPCDTVFTCPECLGSKNCGWCETDGEKSLCVDESDRSNNCGGSKDNWIGQSPPGQQCPNTLFSGTTLDPKSEPMAGDIGGGGFAASGRKSSSEQEILQHKVLKREQERIAKIKKAKASIANCLEKAKLEHGDKVVGTRKQLVWGFWGHVPNGCSVQSKGDWAAHFNLGPGQNVGGAYTIVK